MYGYLKTGLPRIFVLLALTIILLQRAIAAPVLVAKNNFPLDSIDAKEISDLWLGKKRSIGGLGRMRVIDLEPSSPLFKQFYQQIVGLSGKRLEIYWSKKIFSGKSSRPKQVFTTEEVIRLVTKVPGVIGYIDSDEMTDQLKILHVTDVKSRR